MMTIRHQKPTQGKLQQFCSFDDGSSSFVFFGFDSFLCALEKAGPTP
jgi:hypothetical protein